MAHRSLLLPLFLAGLAPAQTLLLDFNSGNSATQTGWQSISGGSGNWNGTYSGITVTVNGTGGRSLDHRDRTNHNGGSEAAMWADFLFSNDASGNGGGLDINLTGLQANSTYPVTLWSYDRSSNGNRAANWSANDAGGTFIDKGVQSFNGSSETPLSLNDYELSFNITTNGAGAITLRGVRNSSSISSHSVFINGLRIDDPLISNVDSDNDDLFDQWEINFFGNITTATGSGNNDTDGLTNLQEQTLGTNPLLADTDSDGIDDDDEMSFNTNPIIADTDGDGLNDGLEISSTNGFVTDPTLIDTDGDSFPDGVEITAGTDPTNGTSFPNGLPLQITEIIANNFNGLEDGFTENEDWIEIFNPNGVDISMGTYSLTDDPLLPAKWSFPDIILPKNSYLVVFASERDLTADPTGFAHTNFKLSRTGEYLALTKSNGSIIEDAFTPSYPEQFTDVSYGRIGNDLRFFSTPTPGAANTGGALGVVADTSFSIDRGLKTAPFNLAITSLTPGASIRYTTDGSKPSPTSGTIYNGPITISSTTTVRAIAYKADLLSTNVDTHTYIFTAQVADQPQAIPGWPSNWITSQFPNRPADYEMDARVKNGALATHTVEAALSDIPTLSIAIPQADFTGSGGIYLNPLTRGIEKECSLELIYPDGTKGFQEDCQLEAHGNSSRSPVRMQKHSFRVTFRKEFGPGRLNFPIFEDTRTDKFNKLVLRACFTDSWGLASWAPTRYRPNDSQYIRDVWMKNSFRDMGQPSSTGNFMHLYINGVYWGLYNPTERIEADMLAENFGGSEEDWEVNEDLTGKDQRYLAMENLANQNLSNQANYEAVLPYIDIENFADYIFLHSYGDSEDWPAKNGYAAANINPATGDLKYRFFVWDQEIALDKFTWRRYNDTRNVGGLFQDFRANAEFRLLFADRVAKHMLNDGALSLEKSRERYNLISGQIDKAIVAESARWGDTQASTPYGSNVEQPSPLNDRDDDAYPPVLPGSPLSQIYFTRENAWLPEKENILNHHLPIINSTTDSRGIIPKLRIAGLYPAIDPPVLSQHGGFIGSGTTVTINGTGSIYYTTDGSDPRLLGGTVNSSATISSGAGIPLSGSQTFKARSLSGGEWSALTEANFIGNDLVISEFMYHPIDASGDAEFIEILNVGFAPISLEGYTLGNAIQTFTFPAYQLEPGARVLAVKDKVAFESIYGTSINGQIAGYYSGSLSNGSETISFRAPSGAIVHEFTYYDSQLRPGIPNWPSPADGQGYSLVLAQPTLTPDHALVSSWRISAEVHGSPGSDDDFTFDEWALANNIAGASLEGDNDNDGLSNLVEFAFATNPNANNDFPETLIIPITPNTRFSFRRPIASTQIVYLIEYSDDLISWDDAGTALFSTVPQGDGTTIETWVLPSSLTAMPRMFVRAKASFTP